MIVICSKCQAPMEPLEETARIIYYRWSPFTAVKGGTKAPEDVVLLYRCRNYPRCATQLHLVVPEGEFQVYIKPILTGAPR